MHRAYDHLHARLFSSAISKTTIFIVIFFIIPSSIQLPRLLLRGRHLGKFTTSNHKNNTTNKKNNNNNNISISHSSYLDFLHKIPLFFFFLLICFIFSPLLSYRLEEYSSSPSFKVEEKPPHIILQSFGRKSANRPINPSINQPTKINQSSLIYPLRYLHILLHWLIGINLHLIIFATILQFFILRTCSVRVSLQYTTCCTSILTQTLTLTLTPTHPHTHSHSHSHTYPPTHPFTHHYSYLLARLDPLEHPVIYRKYSQPIPFPEIHFIKPKLKTKKNQFFARFLGPGLSQVPSSIIDLREFRIHSFSIHLDPLVRLCTKTPFNSLSAYIPTYLHTFYFFTTETSTPPPPPNNQQHSSTSHTYIS
ncbi:hypothetical protein EYC84_003576 [Monilinia fructicola]|uniref:Uncharacterized protein n=1 Tax=Monilinia fructicola TaxID=38448 RepID=A0A5M9JYS2_MONFR|nr:hypothetical protein EYC84_003576 [Monilinia fructicola]